MYSIFLALGEFGPGDNIGLCAAKTSATAIRGQYYSYAAAIGKIGAFVGTYVLPLAQDNAPQQDSGWPGSFLHFQLSVHLQCCLGLVLSSTD